MSSPSQASSWNPIPCGGSVTMAAMPGLGCFPSATIDEA